MTLPKIHVCMFEPAADVFAPYIYFPPSYHFHASHSLSIVELEKAPHLPDLVTVSASFAPEELVDFLWQLKNFTQDRIIPLLFIVNWAQPLSELPGTTWGGKVGVLHSLSSSTEILTTLQRIMK